MPGGRRFRSASARLENCGDIGIGVGSGLEVNLDNADAEQGAGFHVVDAAGQGEEALQRIGDIGFDILRRHAGVERGDHDLGQIDRREQIDRHARRLVTPMTASARAR